MRARVASLSDGLGISWTSVPVGLIVTVKRRVESVGVAAGSVTRIVKLKGPELVGWPARIADVGLELSVSPFGSAPALTDHARLGAFGEYGLNAKSS